MVRPYVLHPKLFPLTRVTRCTHPGGVHGLSTTASCAALSSRLCAEDRVVMEGFDWLRRKVREVEGTVLVRRIVAIHIRLNAHFWLSRHHRRVTKSISSARPSRPSIGLGGYCVVSMWSSWREELPYDGCHRWCHNKVSTDGGGDIVNGMEFQQCFRTCDDVRKGG